MPYNGWHVALWQLAWLRQFLFLPLLLGSVPALVTQLGADAQTVALSCVSILFMLEFDNQLYSYGLDEGTREYLDRHARVELDDAKISFLARVKAAYILVIPLAILWTLNQVTVW